LRACWRLLNGPDIAANREEIESTRKMLMLHGKEEG
jgi:hypothetical protein